MTGTPAAAIDKLIRMANQIAIAFQVQPQDEAIAGIAEHIKKFWTPKMRADIAASLTASGSQLDPLARAALEQLTANPK